MTFKGKVNMAAGWKAAVSGIILGGALWANASLAATSNYDLKCAHKFSMAEVNGYTRITEEGQGVRLSVDLVGKQWCARRDNGGCGTVMPLTINSTEIRLRENMKLDRRTGILTYIGDLGPVTSFHEMNCTKAPFTALPAVKF